MCEITFYYHQQWPCLPYEVLDECIRHHQEHSLTSEFNEFSIDVYALGDDPESRVVAIDFDNTITADPDFYTQLINCLRKRGCKPVVCTIREGDQEDMQKICSVLKGTEIDIYTSNGQCKRDYLKQLGVKVGLWIDDFFPAIANAGDTFWIRNGINF
ncbi:hypothetical protein [Thiolinea disciformis]|uniref:hypothetical protein n=1 Tax=Thiolinea disciformis TaxID=125614 RepID=UPI000369AC0F|nr:hypothetical protein [Thiolinea disciformis]